MLASLEASITAFLQSTNDTALHLEPKQALKELLKMPKSALDNRMVPQHVLALSIVLITLSGARGQLIVSSDTTQNGGVFAVSPPGTVFVESQVSSPLLTLTNGATTSGIDLLNVGASFASSGQLLIDGGSSASSAGTGIGSGVGTAFDDPGLRSFGEVTVTGLGSKLETRGFLDIADGGGDGVLNVLNGGLAAVTSNIRVGARGGNGTITVSGVGSSLSNTGREAFLSVGFTNGVGEINVLNGAQFNVDAFVTLGDGFGFSSDEGAFGDFFPDGEGRLNVSGQGSGLTSSVLQAGDGAVGVIDVSAGATVGAVSVFIGGDAATTGTLGGQGTATVTGGGSSLAASFAFDVGSDGDGSLTISDGARVESAPSNIGDAPGSTGTVLVTGVGSLFDPARLTVGNQGEGSITARAGALVDPAATVIGNEAGAFGLVSIGDVGTRFFSSGLVVGSSGEGAFEIVDGAIGTIFIGSIPTQVGVAETAQGTIRVAGEGSRLELGPLLEVGVAGEGLLEVSDGGEIFSLGGFAIGETGRVAGDGGTIIGDVVNEGLITPGNSPGSLLIDGDLSNSGVIELEVASLDSFDQLSITGEFSAGGAIRIVFLDGFSSPLRSSLDLLSFGSFIDEGVVIETVGLGDGFQIAADELLRSGRIEVIAVPEPAACWLVVAALGPVLLRRASPPVHQPNLNAPK